MRMIFRDRYLSDLIGFEYSRMSAHDAAGHFLDRIRQNTNGRECLVPIILDGENAWEWYEANGRPFLRELYRRISEDPRLEALTVSEALAKFEAEPLHGIFPGSWINANFNIWIGAEEDNQAWELLLAARRAYDETPDVPEHARKLAYEELLIAEGSDWNWWYGPEHGSDNRPEFDQLYRDHLVNVYRALGLVPPEALSRSILRMEQTRRDSRDAAESDSRHARRRSHFVFRMDGRGALPSRSALGRDARRRATGLGNVLRVRRRIGGAAPGWRASRC